MLTTATTTTTTSHHQSTLQQQHNLLQWQQQEELIRRLADVVDFEHDCDYDGGEEEEEEILVAGNNNNNINNSERKKNRSRITMMMNYSHDAGDIGCSNNNAPASELEISTIGPNRARNALCDNPSFSSLKETAALVVDDLLEDSYFFNEHLPRILGAFVADGKLLLKFYSSARLGSASSAASAQPRQSSAGIRATNGSLLATSSRSIPRLRPLNSPPPLTVPFSWRSVNF